MRLTEKEFLPTIVEKTVEHMRSLGLVNDEEFARRFVHDQQMRKPVGKRVIVQKLRLKGVASSIIEHVMSEHSGPDQEHSAALAAAKKYLRRKTISRGKAERMKEQQRLAQFLARNGFDWAAISPVLRTIFTSENISNEGE